MRYLLQLLMVLLISSSIIAQAAPEENSVKPVYKPAKIKGYVYDKATNEVIPGANIRIKKTFIGTATDENGYYELIKLKPGKYIVMVSFIGYQDHTEEINLTEGHTLELNVYLNEGSVAMTQVVVTGTRTEKLKTEAPVIVSVIDPKMFEATQSTTLSEGLNYQTGVRLEVDCQTCNFTQVRMNGLAGSYSQILVNSRPVFSSLNGLYGLEQIPSNMVDRVEIVRGGGSAIYGASAVAGTINIITKEPADNTFSITMDNASIDGKVPERNFMINSSMISADNASGLSVFGIMKDRNAYDANGDGYSELPLIKNNSFGANAFFKPNALSKISFDAHTINEQRRGGNKINEAAHKADQSEDRTHNVYSAGVTYEHFLNKEYSADYSVYLSGQYTDRKHYTGVDGVDAYGTTEASTIVSGMQYNHYFSNSFLGEENVVTAGLEFKYDDVTDKIDGYNHFLSQATREYGLYVQSDFKMNSRLSMLFGGRVDYHSNLDNPVFNPRMNLLFNLTEDLQFRTSLSTGFRAPQAFDADLHVAFAGGGVALIRVADELDMERSFSYSASFDYNHYHGELLYGITLEGFATRLNDTFVLEENGTDGNGNIIMTRKNGGNSTVLGTSLELRANFNNKINVMTGFTYQNSKYDDAVQWSEELEGTTNYLRTPDAYGFVSIIANVLPSTELSVSSVITGPMDVPHVAGAFGVVKDELYRSETFFDTNVKLAYTFKSENFLQNIQIYGGVKNIFNSYQDNFDIGKERDSNFIYGPAKPRTMFAGIKIGVL